MLLLCGKSCTGKTTVINELIKNGMKSIITYTTRPLRHGEINGVTYHFINNEEFLKKKEEGFFAETTSYKTEMGDVYYGSAMNDLADDKVIIVNPEGLKKIKKMDYLNPVVFYLTADEETIWNRLRKRGDNAAEARRRLNSDNNDFKDIDNYIDFSIKNETTFTPKELANMISYLYKITLNKYITIKEDK